jgi:hypothetical protein
MNDVHWYLDGWKPELPGMCYVSGMFFLPVPTVRTPLIGCEGDYTCLPDTSQEGVEVDQLITMQTKCSGRPYVHKNVMLTDFDRIVAYGPTAHFTSVVPSNEIDLEVVKVPKDIKVKG